MEKIPASVGILTRNSGATLRRALESVKAFDDIVICDGGSTDDTLAIAASYGARVIAQNPEFQNPDGSLKDYAGVRNQSLDAARHDWFLYIDSDEEADAVLVEEIRVIAAAPFDSAQDKPLVYNISPRIMLDGRVIEHSSNYPGWQKRFFNKKSGARFRKTIHERIDYDEHLHPAGYLKGHWHYFVSMHESREKFMKYVRMDVALYGTKEWGRFFGLATAKLATMGKVFVRAVWNSILHHADTMPLSLEWRRIAYQAAVLKGLVSFYFTGRV